MDGWAQRPTPQSIEALTPALARLLVVKGQVKLYCNVVTGQLKSCSIIEETPQGLGFAAATIRAVELFRVKPILPNGSPSEGRSFQFFLRFTAHPAPDYAPAPTTYSRALACVVWNSVRLEVMPGDAQTRGSLERAKAYAQSLGASQGQSKAAIASAIALATKGGEAGRRQVIAYGLDDFSCQFRP